MKKKLGILLLLCLLVFMFTSCDEVLSVVTEGEGGEKIVTNYFSMLEDTVYDESASLKSWQDITLFEKDIEMDDLLFKIENKKDNVVVFGSKEAAVELSFFEGGFKFKFFASMDELNNMFKTRGE